MNQTGQAGASFQPARFLRQPPQSVIARPVRRLAVAIRFSETSPARSGPTVRGTVDVGAAIGRPPGATASKKPVGDALIRAADERPGIRNECNLPQANPSRSQRRRRPQPRTDLPVLSLRGQSADWPRQSVLRNLPCSQGRGTGPKAGGGVPPMTERCRPPP